MPLGSRKVYISLDAPKGPEVAEAQEGLISEIARMRIANILDIKVRQNVQNQGVAVSVIAGIDWFFGNEEFGIILEDDLSFNKDFITWCEWSCQSMKEERDIFMISGNRFNGAGVVSYCHYPQTWGWATWRDRWRNFRPYYEGKSFDFRGFISYKRNFWSGGTLRVLATVTDTWDIAIAKYMLDNSLLTVLPPVNLVSNNGADSFSTHTTVDVFPLKFPISPLDLFSLQLPSKNQEAIKMNDWYLEKEIFVIRPRHWFSLIKNLPLLKLKHKLSQKLISNETILH